MDRDALDRLIADLAAAESALASQLVDLDGDPTYKLLAAGPRTGATRARLEGPLSDVGALWNDFSAWRAELAAVREQRDGGRLSDSTVIDLARRASDLDTARAPIADRSRALCEGVAAVAQIWRDVVPRLDGARRTDSELAAAFGADAAAVPAIQTLRDQIAALEAALADDPLGISPQALQSLDAAVAIARERAGDLAEGRARWAADLARAGELIGELDRLARAEADARREAHAKVDGADVRATPTAFDRQSLDARLRELEHATTPWAQRRKLLDRLVAELERHSDAASARVAEHRAPLARRDELRGLLRAYQAKVAARGLAEDAAIAALAKDAHDALYSAPVDLVRAESLVREVGRAVSAARSGKEPA